MLQWVKNWMLPLAMCTGALTHQFSGLLMPLAPVLLFCMLFVTFCHIAPSELRLHRLHVLFLAIQLVAALGLYAVCAPFNVAVAQGVLICVLAPTATSAPVVAGMLGGDIAFMTTFAVLGNVAVAVMAPLVFSLVGTHSELPFLTSLLIICRQVMPVLLLPLLAATLLRKLAPRPHAWVMRHSMLTFYLWALSLTIVTGSSVNFVMSQENPDYYTETLLALAALLVCIVQFAAGKAIGGVLHDRVSGGQALGQKNTILAIWLALMYAYPLASLAPASYVI